MANAGEVSLVLSGKGYAEDRDIDQRVGWWSEAIPINCILEMMGFAGLNPSYVLEQLRRS